MNNTSTFVSSLQSSFTELCKIKTDDHYDESNQQILEKIMTIYLLLIIYLVADQIEKSLLNVETQYKSSPVSLRSSLEELENNMTTHKTKVSSEIEEMSNEMYVNDNKCLSEAYLERALATIDTQKTSILTLINDITERLNTLKSSMNTRPNGMTIDRMFNDFIEFCKNEN